ncbi:hypothetical protein RV12_GL001892 [Enterococcus quebecensis]|nr:hypothetical protein RV12_GL001892 [Enterococcus quebecensis]
MYYTDILGNLTIIIFVAECLSFDKDKTEELGTIYLINQGSVVCFSHFFLL